MGGGVPAPAPAPPPQQQQQQFGGGGSGMDDLLGGLGGFGSAPAPAAAASPGLTGGGDSNVSLDPAPALSAADFQAKWGAWAGGALALQEPLTAAALRSVEANGYRVGAAPGCSCSRSCSRSLLLFPAPAAAIFS